jgi:hypothetical protein
MTRRNWLSLLSLAKPALIEPRSFSFAGKKSTAVTIVMQHVHPSSNKPRHNEVDLAKYVATSLVR